MSFDVSTAVTEALSQNKQRVTFASRVPEQFETDLSYGRHVNWYNSVTLTVRYNTVPQSDEQSLTHGGFVCREGESVRALGGFAGYLQALGIDADDGGTGTGTGSSCGTTSRSGRSTTRPHAPS